MSARMPVVKDRQQLVEVNTGKPEAYCFAGENLNGAATLQCSLVVS